LEIVYFPLDLTVTEKICIITIKNPCPLKHLKNSFDCEVEPKFVTFGDNTIPYYIYFSSASYPPPKSKTLEMEMSH